jgi:hypothetical protein
VKGIVRSQVEKLGYNGEVLEKPNTPYEQQVGYVANEVLNERFEEGLRFLLYFAFFLA